PAETAEQEAAAETEKPPAPAETAEQEAAAETEEPPAPAETAEQEDPTLETTSGEEEDKSK
ncbi:MAG: hypothetical protein VYA53_03710, partial [Acidobacteriota bacterium]|nr:hypothetical protein [Acidobacteriota bacterium]